MEIVQTLSAIVIMSLTAVAVFLLTDIAKSLRDSRQDFVRIQRILIKHLPHILRYSYGRRYARNGGKRYAQDPAADADGPSGFGVWVWHESEGRTATWVLDQDHCGTGFEPGRPPTINGAFDGHRVKQAGVSCGKG